MDIREFYEMTGGNFDEVMSRLQKEERIIKFLKLLKDDKSIEQLESSLDTGDATGAFRAVHSLKGISLNLGLGRLAKSSSELTENLRNKPITEESGFLFQKVKNDLDQVCVAIDGIS